MILNKEAFGTMLAQARVNAGISQIALAKKMGYSSPQYVSNWERGICGPPLDKLHVLSKSLRINPEIILDMILTETEDYLRSELKLKSSSKRKGVK
jgi:transcriptional regulator with XRE-family HTH domain